MSKQAPRNRWSQMVAELRRRRVFRTTVIYAVTAWIIVQVAETVAPLLNLPAWTATLVLLIVILGFPLMLVLAWTYDVLPATPAPVPTVAGLVAPVQAPAAPRSIAVLPFVDMSPERDQEHFSDGIAEEILHMLARLPHLHVAARTSAFAFKGRNEDVRRIGEQLGVATVLEGSVRAAGNRIRISAQLIDVGTGYHRWSERYDRELGDVFTIQDEIAQSIVRALDLSIGGQPQIKPQAITSNMEAYDYFLRGRSYLARLNRQKVEQARVMFAEAIARDPAFAAAYASAATAATNLYLYFDSDPQNLLDAQAYAERALELAPDLPQVRVAHGQVLTLLKRFDDAAGEFEAALQLDPQSFNAHYYYGRSRWAAGDLAGAERHLKRAAEIRPEDYNPPFLLSSVYRALGNEHEIRAAQRETFERAERAIKLNPDDTRAFYVGAGALVALGQKERGIEWAERAIAMDPADPATWYNVACLHAVLGDADLALERLARSVQLGFAHREWMLNDADWQAYHDDPRFRAVLESLSD